MRTLTCFAIAGILTMIVPAVARGQSSAPAPAARKAAVPARRLPPFQVEESTIAGMHRAIQEGRTTCAGVVQAYVKRARAYNGMCTGLVTADGATIAPALGTMRAGAPVSFPTKTTSVSVLLPNFDQYAGPPIDYGRMEPTKSDPKVQQQYGMIVGLPNAGQVNALSTLNLRGERSLTCQATCDAPLSAGPLPAYCPAACTEFRKQPDALERAAQLDAQYGRRPDLKKLPMYCVALSFKDVYDTRDMRTTGGADVNYAMDAPATDSTIVSELRAKGAIIYAKANLSEYNGGSGNPGGAAQAKAREYGAGGARSSWAGTPCNPYDTSRETGGSSSGSAASVSANLSACSICEETGGSCRQPAWRNGVVSLVTTKGLMPYGGAIGADPYLDRAGVTCRTVKDAAIVLDAMKSPTSGYFDPRDIYSALPKGLVSKVPYASFAVSGASAGRKPLAGLRVGIVREYMVKHAANDAAMSDLVNDEIKKVLRDRLGAELVESSDPMYADDPSIANMTYTFQQALAEILPFHMPELLKTGNGGAPYAVDGYDVTKRDYMVKAAEGRAPLAAGLNLRSINNGPSSSSFSFHLEQYLMRRGDERVKGWSSLNANAKYFSEARLAAMTNWEHKVDLVSDGISQDIKMREVMRLVVLKVMQQNRLDVLVNPTTTIPPARIGYPSQPVVNSRSLGRFPTSANVGIPEITVPAGFNEVIYEPQWVLNAAKNNYVSTANNDRKSTLTSPLPVGISFWSGPGEEPMVIRVAAAYEMATKRRTPPPAFGPLQVAP